MPDLQELQAAPTKSVVVYNNRMSAVYYSEMKGTERCLVSGMGGAIGYSAGLHRFVNLLKTCLHIHLDIHLMHFSNKEIYCTFKTCCIICFIFHKMLLIV